MNNKLITILSLLVLIALSFTGCKQREVADESKHIEETKKDVVIEPIHTEEPIEAFEIDPILDMREADLSSYDGVVLSGANAQELLRLFKNSNVSVLIATQMVMDGTVGLNQLDGNVKNATPTVGAKGVQGAVTTSGEVLSDKLTFVNYGAVLKQGEAEVVLEFKDTYLQLGQEFNQALETVEVNQNINRTNQDGYAENLADYLYFQTYIIKDKTDKAVGIALHAIPIS